MSYTMRRNFSILPDNKGLLYYFSGHKLLFFLLYFLPHIIIISNIRINPIMNKSFSIKDGLN